MINAFKVTLLMVLLLFMAQVSARSDVDTGAKNALPNVEMKAIKVSEHVWYVMGKAGTAIENEGFISNSAFIITDEGVVVFDSLGTPALSQMVVNEIKKITQLPIKKVIVSHYHADHIYGLQVYQDLGAEIIAPRGAIDYIQSEAAESRLTERRVSLSPWVNEKTRIVSPDRYIDKSEVITMGDVKLSISALGSAHSEGDLTLFVTPDQVLLSGDVIFDGRIPWLGDSDTLNWLNTLKRISESKPAAIIPGHGKQSNDPDALIKLTLTYLQFVREKMQSAVDNWQTFDDAYDEVDWEDYDLLPAFEEANRRNAYQVFLSLEQESLDSK